MINVCIRPNLERIVGHSTPWTLVVLGCRIAWKLVSITDQTHAHLPVFAESMQV
jgi:hypothetical protein